MARLAEFLGALFEWQSALNLVGKSTLADPWRRHILDCAQLMAHIPDRTVKVADIGSGAGLPGLVLAILGLADMHLIESDGRKCAFLGEAARRTGAAPTIHSRRAEALSGLQADLVVARACAPLDRLLGYAAGLLRRGGRCLFLKGRGVDEELESARKTWHFSHHVHDSLSAPEGAVIEIAGLGHA